MWIEIIDRLMIKFAKYFLAIMPALVISCTGREASGPADDSAGLISIAGDITTRVDDSGFCDKDIVGIYVVDYDGDKPGELLNTGNRADNVMHTYDAGSNRWKSAYDIYWKDGHTHIDIYGYYPFGSPSDVDNYSFELESDQRKAAEYGKPGGYEASDFLWGKASDIAPTSSAIRLGFRHRMACVKVRLNKGLGFTDGEWSAAQKQVVVTNTTRRSVIDLRTGEVRAVGDPTVAGTIPLKVGDEFRAIVVPQTVESGKTLISITIDGVSYYFRKEEDFTYYQAHQHNFTITVSKRSDTGEYEFSMADESITAWEEDTITHDAEAKEYIIINVEEAGTLEECLKAEGKDPAQVKNLKVTGRINGKDFGVMRTVMTKLTALNLAEAVIVAGPSGYVNGVNFSESYDDRIPKDAMYGHKSLVKIILPKRLKVIEYLAFGHCRSLSGSLDIPEGVTDIEDGAFIGCNFSGELRLPSTLENIGIQALRDCPFYCELKLPEGLKTIGNEAFCACRNLYGTLVLPSHLEEIGDNAFYGCENLSGNIVIPQSITTINAGIFGKVFGKPTSASGRHGILVLHDGIESIGAGAFHWAGFTGELRLPKNLEFIGDNAFDDCDFSGTLNLPATLMQIGENAFRHNTKLSGTLTFGKNVQNIGASAFQDCMGLEALVFEDGVECIGENAFNGCLKVRRIVCKGTIPPKVLSGAFSPISGECTLEVPESALQQYQTAEGWREFNRITVGGDLSVSPHTVSTLNSLTTRTLIIDADGEWSVESCPDWVSLDRTEGNGKTEVTLTVSEMPRGSGNRTGEAVFLCNDFRVSCTVSQYDCEYAEDEFVSLQRASRGKGIDIVFLGDGFDAGEISKGTLESSLKKAYEHFFNIEPYRTYKDYFNATMAVSLSPESGVGGVNTIIDNKFNTSSKGGSTLGARNGESDFRQIINYVEEHIPGIDIDKTLVVMVPNTNVYSGMTYLWDEGFAISYCPVRNNSYPDDFRGTIQHEAGGHGFGKLGDEAVIHNSFIDACYCTDPHDAEFNVAKNNGWYENLSLSGKMSEVPWKHLIFHEKYKSIVDIFEGGYLHSRGVFRSEQTSCMDNGIPYYNTVSRESIVKRIMLYAGEEYSFEDFVKNDSPDAASSNAAGILTRSGYSPDAPGTLSGHEPVFMGSLKELR